MPKIEQRTLAETTFAVLDLETSGGSPRLGAGITEIGVVKVRGGEVLGTFQSFVDPGHSLPVFITQLTGISDAMLISAPFIDEILPTLFEFLGSIDDTVVVAHNSPFDLSFLKAAAMASSSARWVGDVVAPKNSANVESLQLSTSSRSSTALARRAVSTVK